jgi:hypothetical protein
MAVPARPYSLPDPDKVITLELAEHSVEQLARQVEAVLLSGGFTKGPAMLRQTLDMSELPASASPDEGVILARFEKKSTVAVFVQVTTCRVALTMRLPDSIDKKIGEPGLLATQSLLLNGLSRRESISVTLIEGLSTRDNPCDAPVRSNKSLERTRER